MSLLVCDASAVVGALVGTTSEGAWCAGMLREHELAAPHLAAFEAANVLRRHEQAGVLTPDDAEQAHDDLLDLAVDWIGFEALASRAWMLRGNLTVYDASYVALAELLDAPLCTLDRRLSRAPGIRCEVLTP